MNYKILLFVIGVSFVSTHFSQVPSAQAQEEERIITELLLESKGSITGWFQNNTLQAPSLTHSRINRDLNQGAGGDWIYLSCKYETRARARQGGRVPLVDLRLIVGPDTKPPAGFSKMGLDLNKGAGGEHIFLCYRCSWNEPPILKINVLEGNNRPQIQGNEHLQTSGKWIKLETDLNKGAGGKYLYLWYLKAKSTGGSPDMPQQNIQTVAGIQVGGRTRGTPIEAQNMSRYNGNWTNNDQLFWGAKAVNDRIGIYVNVPTPGTYQLYAKLTKAPDFGVFVFQLGSSRIGQQDLFARGVTTTGLIPIGKFTTNSAGRQMIIVQVVGKNTQSKGFKFGIDTIEVRSLNQRNAIRPNTPESPTPVNRTTNRPRR